MIKKIYNAVGDNQVWCYKAKSPSFGINSIAIYLYINSPLLSQKSNEHNKCKNTSSFAGLNDFWINNGEQYFHLQKVEVFQIMGD